jgi:hypothetical protein
VWASLDICSAWRCNHPHKEEDIQDQDSALAQHLCGRLQAGDEEEEQQVQQHRQAGEQVTGGLTHDGCGGQHAQQVAHAQVQRVLGQHQGAGGHEGQQNG